MYVEGSSVLFVWVCIFFFQAEDGIRDLVRSRGLGDVYKRQAHKIAELISETDVRSVVINMEHAAFDQGFARQLACLLYTSDAADERSSVDLGGRRIIKKKNDVNNSGRRRLIRRVSTLSKDHISEETID